MTRSARLLDRHADAIAAASAHPLLGAMTDGTLRPSVFARYLALEGRFVETAGELVDLLIDDGPDAADRSRLEALAHDLRGAQRAYFDRLAGHAADVDGTADVLSTHVRGAASRHGTAVIPVCFAAAETLYARWCTEAAETPAHRAAEIQEWIDMHASADFAAGVASWYAMVDRLPQGEVDDPTLDLWFTEMLTAENAFHDSAYPGEHR